MGWFHQPESAFRVSACESGGFPLFSPVLLQVVAAHGVVLGLSSSPDLLFLCFMEVGSSGAETASYFDAQISEIFGVSGLFSRSSSICLPVVTRGGVSWPDVWSFFFWFSAEERVERRGGLTTGHRVFLSFLVAARYNKPFLEPARVL